MYHNVSPGTEAAMEAEQQEEIQRWLTELERDRQQEREDQARMQERRNRPATPTIYQRLITFAARHRYRLAEDTQMHIYSSMAMTDIKDVDLYRLMDSSYSNRDYWIRASPVVPEL
ncbi:hypothetical protein M758_UG094400 [Ceratodon purpureus]|nr:hypothetical protein M758_UG094400 [Ceratodon purpureus]